MVPHGMSDPDAPAAIVLARDIILRHGWNATAYQLLNPGIRLWFSAEGDAVVGYVDRHGVRVVAGAPVCPQARMGEVTRTFEAEATRRGLQDCHFCAGSRLRSVVAPDGRHCAVLIGAQPAWDPARWDDMVRSHSSLRAQLNRARNKEVTVEEWPAERARGHTELRRCLAEWLASRGLPPLHFLIETRTLERPF